MHAPFLMSSPLQDALRDGWTLADLNSKLGIKSKRHPRFPNLVLFVYDQIESPKMNPIVQASRGHILDEDRNWRHVCRPFDRFFNWGEGVQGVTPVPDFSKAVVYKKEDGSLINMWFYNGEWHVSTKGSPDAGGEVGDNKFTFAELFWRVWNEKGLTVPSDHEDDMTFTFELCTLYNKVVCSQPEERIILTAVRDNLTGVETDPRFCEAPGIEICQSYDLGSVDEAIATFQTLRPLDTEGYVVAQYVSGGRVLRAKVKHPGYLALSHLKEGATKRNFMELIRMGEEGEFLSVFPEYTEQFNCLRAKYEILVYRIEKTWQEVQRIADQKEFALAVQKFEYRGVLFNLKKVGGGVKSKLVDLKIDLLLQMIGEK